jgi:hypothetical protein
MTLKEKYSTYNLVHFIEMYDDFITIESHSLNALIFESKEYVVSILSEINELESKNEEELIINFMRQSGWTNKEELSISRLKKELENIKDLKTTI